MPRRVELPGASELFRPTKGRGAPEAEATDQPLSSGRVRHDEKITVYVSSDELLTLEQARLTLRAQHRIAVDRGRIVRMAIALAMADLEANGPDSGLVRRLGEQ